MSHTQWIYCVFLFYSIISLCFFWVRSYFLKRKAYSKWNFYDSIIGIFIAVLFMFIPIYCYSDNLKGVILSDCFSVVLLSIHNSLRVFLLDDDFQIVLNSISGFCKPMYYVYSIYFALLYIIAPILTFTTIVSYFMNIGAEFRFRLFRKKNIYAFSELNDCSIALAKSICETFKEDKPVIVFTDVYEQNEEVSQELSIEADDIKAICLKKDITHLNLFSKKSNVEIFLIGKDEAENISQASLLTERFNNENKKHNIKIFVFATGKENGYIIDSLNYDNLLKSAEKTVFNDKTFKIRRIDCCKQLVWKTVPEMNLFKHCKDKVISVMIAGIGSFGTEFFKMLLWYCQVEDYTLEINIFDKIKDDFGCNNKIESILAIQCPDIFKKNPSHDKFNGNFDIKCFDGIDFKTDSFEKLWNDKKNRERFLRTSHVIVALGDDNTNIETSVYLRSFFDRKNHIIAGTDIKDSEEFPSIYSIVYDKEKSGAVNNGSFDFLKNHIKTPYHIHFIGNIEHQYYYKNIYDSDIEKKTYKCHAEWNNIDSKLMETVFAKDYDESKLSDEDKVKVHELSNELSKYEHYEYYRFSSLACVRYSELNEKYGNSLKTNEKIRWNVYMRTEGYTSGKIRAFRALIHDKFNFKEDKKPSKITEVNIECSSIKTETEKYKIKIKLRGKKSV